jgi:hypothetical protein
MAGKKVNGKQYMEGKNRKERNSWPQEFSWKIISIGQGNPWWNRREGERLREEKKKTK